MLKINSKQARQNLQEYIIKHFHGERYGIEPPSSFAETAAIILSIFHNETRHSGPRMTEQEVFEHWASGLPPILDTCYYYNRSAIDDLGGILEKADDKESRFDKGAAEILLTRLIYRELKRGMK